ncbi:hypothetical protein GCM10009557_21430 [Virgisporangium ochraceum]|uniref:SseB protein N-terminal domain-containing protein n=1 Tax=Virgisporangium ochraceum TaxID=65505 RepID=A0A8J3ZUT5_9ACTN|nr:SseB family protein [Virgisporangium ochraceum]GIJ67895.1 hypothetical protein Voc01_028120 [Virgisporangium ochraceum]
MTQQAQPWQPPVGASPWQPTNEVEARLAEAATKDDRAGFFTILMSAPLFLPQMVDDPDTATGASNEDYVTFTTDDVTYLLAFTSLDTLQASLGDAANGYVESDYETLRAGLEGTDLQIGFNLGTPIDAWLDAESLARAAAGEILVPTGKEMTELLEVADPANAEAVDEAADAELEAFVDDYLTRIVSGDVLVASQNGVALVKPVDGVPSVEAYSEDQYVPPGTATTAIPFMQLVATWPAAAQQLAVNPGTPLEFMLPAEVLTAFSQYIPVVPPVPVVPPDGD